MSRALIPGSFDPITLGHLDIIKRASMLFDEVIVLAAINPNKNYMLCTNSRVSLIQDAIKGIKNVSVDSFDGLLVTYMNTHSIDVIVKGLRNFTDYAYENDMALTNIRLGSKMYGMNAETLYMPCKPEFFDTSSSLVRLMLSQGADVSQLVPNNKLLLSFLQN